jgi:cell division protein FtsI/penicillin-binding protein 2
VPQRIRVLALIWLLSAACLLLRLGYTSVSPKATLLTHQTAWPYPASLSADLEHLSLKMTDDGRGRILYRSGQPWSGATHVEAVKLQNGTRITTQIHNELTGNRLSPVIGQVGKPDVWPSLSRIVEEQGRSGLELTFDEWLMSRQPAFLGALKDAKGTLSGRVFETASIPGDDVRTTIDYAWQRTAESLLKRYGVNVGAIVILDVKSHDVLAMASQNERHPLENTAVRAFTPGSIFKLVTAAAAFEMYLVNPETPFYCTGKLETPSIKMHCWRPHGAERFIDAIAESCDVVFASVGTKVKRSAILYMAKQVGILTPGLQYFHHAPVLREAENGNVFLQRGEDDGLVANTAIGQQDVKMTPLQAANLACTVANRGRYQDVRLVLDIEHAGHIRHRLRMANGHRAFSRMTAFKLRQGMRLAVTSPRGTAHALLHAPVQAAIKTGTAELSNGNVNGWMVGFAPYKKPDIAFSVLVANEKSSQAHAATLKIVQGLLAAYRQYHPSTVIE